MKPGTIPRVELPRHQHQLPPYRLGHWVLAGTPGWLPYPCTCRYDPCRYERCPDRGRPEGLALPPGCCGRRPPVAGERTEAPGGGANAQRGRSSTWRPREAAPVAQHPALVAEDLWGTPWDETPPAWDAIDEASPVVTETLEAPGGHSHSPEAVRQHSEPAERPRPSVADLHCDCRTPWDPPAPVLLIARTKTGPVVESIELPAGPRVDVRAEAQSRLVARGCDLRGGWKDGRHTLLPPDGKLKTRPGWVAELSGDVNGSAWAVIDCPSGGASSGVHCSDCHRNFANVGAHQLHKPHWLAECRDPAQVRELRHGSPLMKQGAGGVWSVDPLAVWDKQGPPGTPAQAQQTWRVACDRLAAVPRWRFGQRRRHAT